MTIKETINTQLFIPLSTDTGMGDGAEDIIVRTLAFANESPTTKLVSKSWHKSSFYSQQEIVEGYKSHPKLSQVVSQIAPDISSPTAEQSPHIVRQTRVAILNRALSVHLTVADPEHVALSSLLEQVEQREEQIRDENFLTFFNCLNNQIPEEQRPQIAEDLALHEKATHLRTWMGEHQDLLDTITFLNLSGLNLAILPDEIRQLTALDHLDLSNNQLTALPAAINQLTALRILMLSNNQLTALPAVICQLTALRGLDLSNNQLTALPAAINQLTALQVLYLTNNPLTALPVAIRQLTDREYFPLEIFPAAMRGLPTL